jgi:uncharacterized protein (TIGR00369 family)
VPATLIVNPSSPSVATSTPSDTPAPPGFAPLSFGGAYFLALGAVYQRPLPDGSLLLLLRVNESHLNVQGVAHGGMLATFADGALGVNISRARGKRVAQVTVSLTADFLSSARLGDWLSARVVVNRVGKSMAFANCDLFAGEQPEGGRHVLRSSTVFAFVNRPLPPDALAHAESQS